MFVATLCLNGVSPSNPWDGGAAHLARVTLCQGRPPQPPTLWIRAWSRCIFGTYRVFVDMSEPTQNLHEEHCVGSYSQPTRLARTTTTTTTWPAHTVYISPHLPLVPPQVVEYAAAGDLVERHRLALELDVVEAPVTAALEELVDDLQVASARVLGPAQSVHRPGLVRAARAPQQGVHLQQLQRGGGVYRSQSACQRTDSFIQ